MADHTPAFDVEPDCDVGLDLESEDRSRDADGVHGPIYSHGYSLRVRILSIEKAQRALKLAGWSTDSTNWIRSVHKGCERWIIRGSTFLTQRKPRNARLALMKVNKKWKTRFYSVQVELRADGHRLDLQGVRRADVGRLLESIMLLSSTDYAIEHYRAAERYFVLAAHEAMALGVALGQAPFQGKGRIAAKQFTVKDFSIPVNIKKRSTRLAKLTVYRISKGATCAFKVEIRLAGRTRDRGNFAEADIEKLDEVLLSLIAEYDLHPVPKPARWEPTTPTSWRRDETLERLGASAYRGRRLKPGVLRAVEECHTPDVCLLAESERDPTGSPVQPYIRQHSPSWPINIPPRSARSIQLWKAVSKDIIHRKGLLSEVILQPEQDPADLIEALVREAREGSVAVQALCPVDSEGRPRTWGTVSRLVWHFPQTQDLTTTLVLVIDTEVLAANSDAVLRLDPETLTWKPGPLLPPTWLWDTMPLDIKATAAWLWTMLEGLRDIAEASGGRIVLVTTDARPEHGMGDLRRSHFFRDPRVRSHIGDAGRFWCHTRYLVEPDRFGRPRRAVMVKDEGEGLMGRIIFGR